MARARRAAPFVAGHPRRSDLGSTQPRVRRSGAGTVVVALILIVIGGYYLLRNTLGVDLPELDSNQVVPVIAVLIGAALLYRAWRDSASA